MISFSEIENAFHFVSSDMPEMHHAVLNRKTGKIYYSSDMTGESDFPEDMDSADYIEIPHQNELGLGKELVFNFVWEHIPERIDDVEYFFRKRGAYHRYKTLLASLNLLDQWHEYQDQRMKAGLLEWCKMNDLDVE